MNEQELRLTCLQIAISSPVGSGDVIGDAKRFLEFLKGESPKLTIEEANARSAQGFNALAETMYAGAPTECIKKVAASRGYTLAQILGRRRGARLVAVRHEAIRAVAKEFPGMSSVEMGRLFGMDHTSILYALKSKREAPWVKDGAPPPPPRRQAEAEVASASVDASEAFKPNAYTINQFMDAYGIRRNKVYDEINSGRLRVRKCGSRTLISRADADAWLEALPTA